MTQPKERECLLQLAEQLSHTWVARTIGGDVLVWIEDGEAAIRVAFRNRATTLERIYGFGFNNRRHQVDFDLQSKLGFQPTLEDGFHSDIGQRLSTGEVSWDDEIVPELEEMVSQAFQKCSGEAEQRPCHVSLMPTEGSPLSAYASGKKGWQKPKAPPTTVLAKLDAWDARPPQPVLDMCGIVPRIDPPGPDLVARAWKDAHRKLLDGKPTADFMVMHATTPTTEGAAAVARCKGWMFASLGVGMVPSVMFGPLVLFAGVDLILMALKPYRKRGVYPVSVYNTDVWTAKQGSYPKIARTLLGQLTGHPEYDEMHERHQWILGDIVKTTGFSGAEAKLLTSTKELARTLRNRSKKWSTTMTKEDAAKRQPFSSEDENHYPYLEGKTNGTVTPDSWKLAIVAKSYEAAARKYLKTTGVTCKLIVVSDPEVDRENLKHWGMTEMQDAWGWSMLVARTVCDYAEKNRLVRNYEA